MRALQAMRRRNLAEARAAGDHGFTMVEMMVTVAILTVFMGLFIGAVVQMTSATTKQQSLDDAQFQVTRALQRLEFEVRYAAYVTTPGTNGLDWYEELYTTVKSPAVCTQIRLRNSTQVLEQRTWNSTGGPATPTAWTPLANRVINDPVNRPPFALVAAVAPVTKQRVTFDILSGRSNQTARNNSPTATTITYTVSNYQQAVYDAVSPQPCSSIEVPRS